jgi:hypothetical protein
VRGFYENDPRQHANRSGATRARCDASPSLARRSLVHTTPPQPAVSPNTPSVAARHLPRGRREMRPLAGRQPPFLAHAQRQGASQPLSWGSSRRSRVRGFYGNAARRHASQPTRVARRPPGRGKTAGRAE